MIRSLSHYFSLVVMVVMLSCSDDDTELSRTDLLTSRAWVATKYETEDGEVSDIIECSKDDVLGFSKDGKFVSAVGAVKCDDDQEDEYGTWSLKDNDQVLSITVDNVTNDVTIMTLTSSTLKLKVTGVIESDGEVIGEYNMYLTFSGK